MKFISLDEARQTLGNEVFITLEPEDIVKTKRKAGKEDQIWGFDVNSGSLCRPDLAFRKACITMHPRGYPVLAVIEEPKTPDVDLVGHIIVDVNPRGLIRAREAVGLNGSILELKPSSLSKGEIDQSGRDPGARSQANPQVIKGIMGGFLNEVDFPDEEGMTPSAFLAQSEDGRSLAIVAKLFFADK